MPLSSPHDEAVGAVLARMDREFVSRGFHTSMMSASKHESVVWGLDYAWRLRFESPQLEGELTVWTVILKYEIAAFGVDPRVQLFRAPPEQSMWFEGLRDWSSVEELEVALNGFLLAYDAELKRPV